MDIALGKGYLDTLLVKLGIDGAIEVADDVQTPDDGTQLEIERAVTEIQKQHIRIGQLRIALDNLGVLVRHINQDRNALLESK